MYQGSKQPQSNDDSAFSSEEDSSETSTEEEEASPARQLPPTQNLVNTMPATLPQASNEDARLLAAHHALLQTGTKLQDTQEVSGAPLFTPAVQKKAPQQFTQYGFIAGVSKVLEQTALDDTTSGLSNLNPNPLDPRLFFNIAAPSSAFICGSQGSGKSHTLSCLLENCLMKSDVSKLENPLAGLVFHYDSFTSDLKGTPCEAAYLASNPAIKVRILCPPTNLQTTKRTYSNLNVTIEPLQINQSHLNTKRMLDLMAVKQDDGSMPLYLHEITRILREMRLEQQDNNSSFNYAQFKAKVAASPMTPAQLMPLNQRLSTLESFMPKSQVDVNAKKKKGATGGNDWTVRPGQLTIVDLSCPCVTAEGACSLFNMCLSVYLEQTTTTGRVVALDEAHKYMSTSGESASLTSTLLSSIRLQRHLGTRVFISTQEPTISPALLDLCSITIVHRFSSPEWLRCLRSHLAALSSNHEYEDRGTKEGAQGDARDIFGEIVKLRIGEALAFAPSALVGVEKGEMKRLGTGYLKVRVRARVTEDGGKSVMAT